ncbi:DNA methyltransferase [Corynebacterium sp. HS2168-gen11]|uniref:DNA methyltransferase n=1 Tax=Corynebacterium sp. HS2168-gen11 TaxID=2974027 RepID=UPI00216ABB29|nr:DNA methyltransferase [Corynebacterium sp. HS2168-gen11]MCS4535917.1 N-6 DNA methylase [Corynebacterium sp. HS2168-gen11]
MSAHAPVLDRTTIRHNLTEFKIRWLEKIEEWKTENRQATESSHDQQFWAGLLGCFGINAQELYIYQRSAKRASTGRIGKIDMFIPGKVIGEAKSLGKGVESAYSQALDYLQGGTIPNSQMPAYVLCSDFETIRVTRLGRAEDAGQSTWDERFPLSEIDEHVEQLVFLADYETTAYREEEAASLEASRLMVELFRAMNGDDVDEKVGNEAPINPEDEDARVQQTSMYLTRILFLLFGDDSGLWEPKHLFADFVTNETTPENLGVQLNALFDVLNTPENKRSPRLPGTLAKFPYVNGALFAEPLNLEYFDVSMRDALLAACAFDWSKISVATFGSLFQLVKSKQARRGDGEHYTSEKNILKTLNPLFLNELREQANKLVASPSTPVRKLEEFRDSLAEMVFCDPACGAGNFLIVAYRELRKIETDLIVAIRQRRGETGMALDISWEQKLSIGQFYGFEINWWPAKIAETAMFLVDHQSNKELANAVGRPPERLPITITAHIHHGNALALDWAQILPKLQGMTYVFGNPPFIGQYSKTGNQKADMKRIWGKDYDGYLDYVTGWHAQAMHLYKDRSGEFAYVTTNSITQGQPVPALFGTLAKQDWRIKFAHRTFAWDSEAPGKAAVHCVIVGFSRDRGVKQRLWDYPDAKGDPVEQPVEQGINAYLVDGPWILSEKRMRPLSNVISKATRGAQSTDNGHLLVKAKDYEEVAADPIAAKYLRRFRGSEEIVNNLDRWCLWMAGDDFQPSDIAKSPVLRERVQLVKKFREEAKPTGDAYKLRNTPHLFRGAKMPQGKYLIIPRVVSETRKFFTVAFYDETIVPSDAAFWLPYEDEFAFSLFSSSMFITWLRTVGGRMKSDLRFSNTLVWNTFPVPDIDDATREKIIKAGKKVLEARALYPNRSLADLYNPLAMSPELLRAHDALDREVDKAMGAPRKLTSARQRQEILFANYARLTKS